MKPGGYRTDREWIVANGLGGYASSTVVGANTRTYHGLLVAAMDPPVNRWLLLSSLDEEVVTEENHLLSNHQYPGAIHPRGYTYLEEFSLDPFPVFRYRAGRVEVEKTVFMVHEENTTVVIYRVKGDCLFRIVPLVTSRSFHAASGRPTIRQDEVHGGVVLSSECDLHLLSDGLRYRRDEQWYYNVEYEAERRRGLGWREDLFTPGRFETEVEGEATFGIVATTETTPETTSEGTTPYTADPGTVELPVRGRLTSGLSAALEREAARAAALKAGLDEPLGRLAVAADSFLVRRGKGKSIIAGYPWFDDWGRDAMISLPGLLLVPGRFSEARAVLETFASAMRGGVLPNDLGARSYNTVDASLWFVRALHGYYRYTGDLGLVRDLWPSLTEVVDAYVEGTPVARADSDGLIFSKAGMTWMDARVGGVPVTPRAGKACEINALWYAALLALEEMAGLLGMTWDDDLAYLVKKSYKRFWNPEKKCLYDVIDPIDEAVRPNMVVAAAFSSDLISQARRRSIVDAASRELLTPCGLRTLSPGDPAYVGRYEGDPRARDGAYHQGTVWPWLMGPYATAYVASRRYTKKSRAEAGELLRPLLEQEDAGLGTVSEVYDGDMPQRPGGCISQAWSVAEVMRAWHEDVMGFSSCFKD